MRRYWVGLIVGALAGAGAALLGRQHLSLLAVVVALASGLLIGPLVGWRAPQPRAALRAGSLAGAIAGALLAAGALIGGVAAARSALAVALVSLALCVGLSAALAGMVSAWTGYPNSDIEQAEQLERTGVASGPLGPSPNSA